MGKDMFRASQNHQEEASVSSVQEGSQRVLQNLMLSNSLIKKKKKITKEMKVRNRAGEIVRKKAFKTIISPSCSYSRKTHCLCLSH